MAFCSFRLSRSRFSSLGRDSQKASTASRTRTLGTQGRGPACFRAMFGWSCRLLSWSCVMGAKRFGGTFLAAIYLSHIRLSS